MISALKAIFEAMITNGTQFCKSSQRTEKTHPQSIDRSQFQSINKIKITINAKGALNYVNATERLTQKRNGISQHVLNCHLISKI